MKAGIEKPVSLAGSVVMQGYFLITWTISVFMRLISDEKS